jgi:hypothetical protein
MFQIQKILKQLASLVVSRCFLSFCFFSTSNLVLCLQKKIRPIVILFGFGVLPQTVISALFWRYVALFRFGLDFKTDFSLNMFRNTEYYLCVQHFISPQVHTSAAIVWIYYLVVNSCDVPSIATALAELQLEIVRGNPGVFFLLPLPQGMKGMKYPWGYCARVW